MNHWAKWAVNAILLATALVWLAAPAAAGQKLRWREISHLSQVHKIKGPDAGDHLLGVYQHQGVCLFPDGQAAAYETTGVFDVYDRSGGSRTHRGYGEISFSDGSAIIFKTQGVEYFVSGDKLPKLKGTGSFISGTGRYQGIRGSLSFSGGYVTGLTEDDTGGEAVLNYQADYTLVR
jgi:hypothetical protein